MISVLIVQLKKTKKTNFTAQHLLTPTFNGAVDAAVVSSFGHLEHPRPQKVLIRAVGRRVTPTASHQEEGNAAAQQQRAAQLHCHSGGFKHCQSVKQTNQVCVFSGEALKFHPVSCTLTSLLDVPLAETIYKTQQQKKSLDQRVLRSRAIAGVLAASGLAASSQTW